MFDIPALIETVGLIGIFAILFAESGLLIGFFLPGDSLIFTAGLLASQGYFSITLLLLGSFAAAVAGDAVGYAFGKRVGPKIFTKEDSLFFRKAYVEKTRDFFSRYGKKTIVIARFIPIVRTFAPILAGVGQMRYREFAAYNVVGALLWAVGIGVLGYFLGATVPGIENYILPIIILIVLTSFIPPAIELLRNRKKTVS